MRRQRKRSHWNWFIKLSTLLLITFGFFLTPKASATERLAVLEIGESNIPPQVLISIMDRVRAGILKAVDGSEILIMTRENMNVLLQDQGIDASCVEGQCEVEIGRNIGATFVVSGSILEIPGEAIVLTLKMHGTKEGNLIATEIQESKTVKGLLDSAQNAGFQIARSLGGNGSQNSGAGVGQFGQNTSQFQMNQATGAIVNFESEPSGAEVRVDGRYICDTPCNQELAGNIKVEMNLRRYDRWEELVNTSSKQTVNAKLVAQFGLLSVSSTPSDLKIKINGDSYRTPVNTIQLPIGVAEVLLDEEGYHQAGERVDIKSGNSHNVQLNAQQQQGGLIVRSYSENGGAKREIIKVDKKQIGLTPFSGPLQIGVHEIQVGSQFKRLRIQQGQVLTLLSVSQSDAPLLVTTEPSGAPILLDGSSVGTTPVRSKLAIGLHSIQIDSAQTETTYEIHAESGDPSVLTLRWTKDKDNEIQRLIAEKRCTLAVKKARTGVQSNSDNAATWRALGQAQICNKNPEREIRQTIAEYTQLGEQVSDLTFSLFLEVIVPSDLPDFNWNQVTLELDREIQTGWERQGTKPTAQGDGRYIAQTLIPGTYRVRLGGRSPFITDTTSSFMAQAGESVRHETRAETNFRRLRDLITNNRCEEAVEPIEQVLTSGPKSLGARLLKTELLACLGANEPTIAASVARYIQLGGKKDDISTAWFHVPDLDSELKFFMMRNGETEPIHSGSQRIQPGNYSLRAKWNLRGEILSSIDLEQRFSLGHNTPILPSGYEVVKGQTLLVRELVPTSEKPVLIRFTVPAPDGQRTISGNAAISLEPGRINRLNVSASNFAPLRLAKENPLLETSLAKINSRRKTTFIGGGLVTLIGLGLEGYAISKMVLSSRTTDSETYIELKKQSNLGHLGALSALSIGAGTIGFRISMDRKHFYPVRDKLAANQAEYLRYLVGTDIATVE